MDLNYCTVCYRETPGCELYCSDTCRLSDTPEDMRSSPSSSSVVPAPVSPTGDSGFAAARRMGFRFRNYSGSSSDEEDDGVGSNEFVLPATRNVIFQNGAVAAQGTTGFGLKHHNIRAGGNRLQNAHNNNNRGAAGKKAVYQPFGLATNNNNNKEEDYLDSEVAIFAALARPTSLEHRNRVQEKEQRQMAKYVFKKEFPAAF